MELLQLKYFCDAALTQNFSRTAERFHVPASDISQMMKRLEEELGVQLFDRRANSLTLNERGAMFYKNAHQALALLDEARVRLPEDGEPSGEIRLLVLANRRSITGAIERFKSEHPKINFVIDHNVNSLNREFDLIISDELRGKQWKRDLLITEDIGLAIKRGSHLLEREELDVRDLAGERFITMQDKSSLHRLTLQLCAAAGFTPNIAIQTDDPFYMRRYIELGLGIAFVPLISWQGQFSDGIVCRPIGNVKRRTYLYRRNERYTPKYVQAFADLLLTEYSRLAE